MEDRGIYCDLGFESNRRTGVQKFIDIHQHRRPFLSLKGFGGLAVRGGTGVYSCLRFDRPAIFHRVRPQLGRTMLGLGSLGITRSHCQATRENQRQIPNTDDESLATPQSEKSGGKTEFPACLGSNVRTGRCQDAGRSAPAPLRTRMDPGISRRREQNLSDKISTSLKIKY